MSEINKKGMVKYIFWAIIALLVIFSYVIIQQYIVSLITAFVLAYLVKPVYDKFNKKFNNKISAALSILLILIVIILPLLAIIGGVVAQASNSLNASELKTVIQTLSENPLIQKLNLELLTNKILSLLISLLTSVVAFVPAFILSLIIILFGTFYILINWNTLSSNLKKYIPFKNKQKVTKEISQVTDNLVYGVVLIALIEFVVAAIGFYFSGVEYFLLLSALLALTAFIPGIGPTFVWALLAIYNLFITNYYSAIGIIITGLIISIYIDTILRYKILETKTKINPIIMLIGVLGGVPLFGIFGFIIGPLILVYTIKLLQNAVKQE